MSYIYEIYKKWRSRAKINYAYVIEAQFALRETCDL